MFKDLRSLWVLVLSYFLPTCLWAFTPGVGTIFVDPNGVFTKSPTLVTFATHVAIDPQHLPSQVLLLRLQADASFKKVTELWDDGTHGDRVKGDGIYTGTLTLKEPLAGMLCFIVEATYPGNSRVRSHPVFIDVLGGASKKDEEAILETQMKAGQLLNQLQNEKGLDQAKKETIDWLNQQSNVAGVNTGPNQDIFVKYKMGVTMTLHLPNSSTVK